MTTLYEHNQSRVFYLFFWEAGDWRFYSQHHMFGAIEYSEAFLSGLGYETEIL
jgi:hypothetical protein